MSVALKNVFLFHSPHSQTNIYPSELLQTKLGKKGQTVFTCHARSTLEAALVAIINETRFCDLSKWTGNKSLLIGHSQGWRQCGGLWFSCTREDRGGPWSCRCREKCFLNLPERGLFKTRINVPIYQHEGQLDELAGERRESFIWLHAAMSPHTVSLCIYI